MNDAVTVYARANGHDDYNTAKRALMAEFGDSLDGSAAQDAMTANTDLDAVDAEDNPKASSWNQRMVDATVFVP